MCQVAEIPVSHVVKQEAATRCASENPHGAWKCTDATSWEPSQRILFSWKYSIEILEGYLEGEDSFGFRNVSREVALPFIFAINSGDNKGVSTALIPKVGAKGHGLNEQGPDQQNNAFRATNEAEIRIATAFDGREVCRSWKDQG
jgi:hypothetical protein